MCRRFAGRAVLLSLLVITGCANSDTSSEKIATLEEQISELENELEDVGAVAATEPVMAQTEPSTSATIQIDLSRETLTAVRDCEVKSKSFVPLIIGGDLNGRWTESPQAFGLFQDGYDQMMNSCRAAQASLEVDALQLGENRFTDELDEELKSLFRTFSRFIALRALGDMEYDGEPIPDLFPEWEDAQRFPTYLATFLEDYSSR